MTSIEPTAQIQGLHGMVHGGQQPISGASVQLIVAGSAGYGVYVSGSVIASATTGSNGGFTLTPPSSCPSNSGLVYILATGGNAGAGTNNSIAEAAILGPCSGLSSLSSVSVTEVTTVAAAYALAPFATVVPGTGGSQGSTYIGTSSTNLTGLYNAAAAAGNLASLSSGQAPGATSISGIVLPTNEMNTLANILASCVNSGTTGVASTNCTTLFTDATPPGGSAPTDTFQAAIDIALNPGNNAGPLYLLATPAGPYQPTLSTSPGDFALGIIYIKGDLNLAYPQGIDIDAQGNAWVSLWGCGRPCPGGVSGLMEISPSGVVSPSSGEYLVAPVGNPYGGLANPQALAIDNAGLVDIADFDLGIWQWNPSTSSGSNLYSTTSSIGPSGIAINDNDGSIWFTGYNNNTVYHLSSAGALLTGSPFSAGESPWGVALNTSADVVVVDSDSPGGGLSAITALAPNGSGGYNDQSFSTGTGLYPSDVAFDHSGNYWATVNTGPVVYSSSNALVSPTQSGYASNAANISDSIAIDGLGRAFISNNTSSGTQAGTLTVWANDGTLISTANNNYGYFANNTISVDPFIPRGLALDASGNCWIAGNTFSAATGLTGVGLVTELVGIAAPALTPLSVQVSTNQLGVRP